MRERGCPRQPPQRSHVGPREGTEIARLGELVSEAVGDSYADATKRAYARTIRQFEAWALERGQSALPALPATVAAYLADRADRGASISTVRADAAGIAAAHRAAGHDTPTASEGVRATLRGLARQRAGRRRRQAQALTDGALAAIRATACLPRRGRGGALEIPANAEERGKVDIGLCALASDAGLRRAELAELAWGDIEAWEDGSGRLTVRRSKTDQEGEGAVVYLSPQTMRDLEAIRPGGADGTEPVFALGPAQLSRRIAAAARAAGLGDGFSGHSGRVGLARRMTARGAPTADVMRQGRWVSPAMVASYTRGEAAGQAARYLA